MASPDDVLVHFVHSVHFVHHVRGPPAPRLSDRFPFKSNFYRKKKIFLFDNSKSTVIFTVKHNIT